VLVVNGLFLLVLVEQDCKFGARAQDLLVAVVAAVQLLEQQVRMLRLLFQLYQDVNIHYVQDVPALFLLDGLQVVPHLTLHNLMLQDMDYAISVPSVVKDYITIVSCSLIWVEVTVTDVADGHRWIASRPVHVFVQLVIFASAKAALLVVLYLIQQVKPRYILVVIQKLSVEIQTNTGPRLL
jgi:hypothetical protein